MNTNNMIRTPKHGIPLGVPVKNPEGTYSLRVKKAGENTIEDVPIDQIFALVVSNATEVTPAETPSPRDSQS